jgi:hypothetical protein
MTQHDTRTIVATFAVYLAICLALGFVAWRRTPNLKDFILGGRSLGPGDGAFRAGHRHVRLVVAWPARLRLSRRGRSAGWSAAIVGFG